MSNRFGETKGPILVWVVLTAWVTAYALGLSLLPASQTLSPLTAVLTVALFYGVSLALLAAFVRVREKRRSLADLISSLGLRKAGTRGSLLWGLLLLPAAFVVGNLAFGLLPLILGSPPSLVTRTGSYPPWYLWFQIVEALVPVAFVEEMFGRGYMLDRMLPGHPSTVRAALPAILLSAVLFTLWHLPSYVRAYSLPLPWIAGLLGLDVFPMTVIVGLAYVRARSRNIAGVVLIHFLADALPAVAALMMS